MRDIPPKPEAAQDCDLYIEKILDYMDENTLHDQHSHWNEMLAGLTRVIELVHYNALAYLYRGVLYRARDQLTEAIQDFSRSIELAPENLHAYILRANIYKECERTAEALTDFNYIIEMMPNEPKAYINRGILYKQSGQYQKAFIDFNYAIKLDPTDPAGFFSRGETYNDQGQWDAAIQDFTYAINLGLGSEDCVYVSRAYAYVKQGQFIKAFNDFQEIKDKEHIAGLEILENLYTAYRISVQKIDQLLNNSELCKHHVQRIVEANQEINCLNQLLEQHGNREKLPILKVPPSLKSLCAYAIKHHPLFNNEKLKSLPTEVSDYVMNSEFNQEFMPESRCYTKASNDIAEASQAAKRYKSG